MNARVKLAAQLAAVGLVVALLAVFAWRLANRTEPVTGTAPAFTLPRLDQDGELSFASLRGKVVVVNFWASWCYPACYEEAPVLERNWRAHRERGLVVIGVDIQDTAEKAQKFVNDFGLTFPNARDVAGKISIDYGVYGVPETFFVDRKGRIRAKHVGAVTDDVFRKHVEPLLAEPA